MNMRSKLRCFRLPNPKADNGFTLVELIVVIAIIAVLGGVAVPAYSGYVERAKYAADNERLAAVNKAFASSCAVKGESHIRRNDASINLADGVITKVTPYNEEFKTFFDVEGKFEVVETLFYSSVDGNFVYDINQASGDVLISYGDGFVSVSKEAIAALKDSTYYSDALGSETLMNQVDRVAEIAGFMGTVANVKATHGFANAVLTSLGLPITGDYATDALAMGAAIDKLALEKAGLSNKKVEELTEAEYKEYKKYANSISDNALVLYTAQSTTAMGMEDAKKLLNDTNSTTIQNAMNGQMTEADKAKGMNQAALAYGMYYAYVNSEQAPSGLTAEQKANPVATDVTNALDNDPNFKAYINSPQGAKDMEAYLQALNVLNSSTQSPEAAEKLMTDGFSSQDLIDILEQTMGK